MSVEFCVLSSTFTSHLHISKKLGKLVQHPQSLLELERKLSNYGHNLAFGKSKGWSKSFAMIEHCLHSLQGGNFDIWDPLLLEKMVYNYNVTPETLESRSRRFAALEISRIALSAEKQPLISRVNLQ